MVRHLSKMSPGSVLFARTTRVRQVEGAEPGDCRHDSLELGSQMSDGCRKGIAVPGELLGRCETGLFGVLLQDVRSLETVRSGAGRPSVDPRTSTESKPAAELIPEPYNNALRRAKTPLWNTCAPESAARRELALEKNVILVIPPPGAT